MINQIKGHNGKILLAALAGTTAGIVVGLLMAPEAGKNTRDSIRGKAVDFSGVIKKALRKYTGKAKKKKGGKGKKKNNIPSI